MKTYYNESLDMLVKFNADNSFVIIGDEKLVSDDMLLALSIGSLPEGWSKVNG